MARGKQAKRAKGPAKNKRAKLPDLEIKNANDVRGGAEWASIQRYGVWEANRKAFVYPENFIQPTGKDPSS
jgi:hypothetical protein